MTDDVVKTIGEIVGDMPLMAILRGYDTQRTLSLAAAAWDLGITAVEVPVQSPPAVATLAAVVAAAPIGTTVGAGTVTTLQRLRAAVDAGAGFTVAPGLDADIFRASVEAGLPHLPGVATATEIHAAVALGAVWLKAFPASVLGPEWFRAMRDPFPEVFLVATGGMQPDDAGTYLDAGAAVIGMGSALAQPGALQSLAHLATRRSSGDG